MQKEALEYLMGERICSLAVEMPDGSPHAAALHFALIEEPLTFIFVTDPSSQKHKALASNNKARASVVVGFVEGDTEKTLQLDGTAQLVDTPEIRKAYYAKFPESEGLYPENVFFTFTSLWWRYTDLSKPEGKMILTSDSQ